MNTNAFLQRIGNIEAADTRFTSLVFLGSINTTTVIIHHHGELGANSTR